MATTTRFKQINAFVARQKEAPHAAAVAQEDAAYRIITRSPHRSPTAT